MADNRMFLRHRSTGLAVYLGKRMGMVQGWYNVPADLGQRLQRLFDELKSREEFSDDWTVAMEDATDAPGADDCWRYGAECFEGGDSFVRLVNETVGDAGAEQSEK